MMPEASRIKTIRETDRKTRLEQAAMLRSNYDEKYSWEKQLTPLVAVMFMMVSGMIFIPCNFFTLLFNNTCTCTQLNYVYSIFFEVYYCY